MYKILVVDSGTIDRQMVRDVLEKKFASAVDISTAAEGGEASAQVKKNIFDLLIVNIPYHSRYSDFAESLIQSARASNADVSLILTSVKREDRISRIAVRLNADGYLLKPYRRDKLTALVGDLIARMEERTKTEDAAETEEDALTVYLKLLDEYIRECDYKKSKNTAKDYMSQIYADDNSKNIRSGVVNFAQGITEIGRMYANEKLQKKLENSLERFFTNYNVYMRRFESMEIIEDMIDSIFLELEHTRAGTVDEMKKVLNYIELNIKSGITLDSAAEHINMSPSYFSKVFKKATGTNFIVYVTDRRMEIAKDMLQNTDMPVINIACELSYNETNYFSKVFKKKVGLSPTEYRQRFSVDRHTEG